MKYISESNGSSLAPKIVGVYERELHPIIEEIISTNYERIVNIGCGEGYYAVGFAHRMRAKSYFHVYAYDIDPKALQNLIKLSKINSVVEKVIVKMNFDHSEFKMFSDKRTLIFCDIEGHEVSLLDPNKALCLLSYDILVEVHDGGSKSNSIKKKLEERFTYTHSIQLIIFTERTAEDYKLITWTKDIEIKKRALSEGRIHGLEWMWLKRKNF